MTTSADKEIEILPEEWRAAELVKRVRKLRWIGLEQEAAKLQRASAFFSPGGESHLLRDACDTD